MLSLLYQDERWIVFGDDQSGKTSLSKKLFIDSFSHGYTPLLIDGASIKTSTIDKIVSQASEETYPDIELSTLLSREDLVLIVDDLSKSPINANAKKKLIAHINQVFPKAIILASEPFQFAASDFPSLDGYEKAKIIPFGHLCRTRLINKWVELELGEEAPENQIWKRKDELKTHVDALVRKNIVPSKPFFILMIIQAFDLGQARSLEMTSYGHCYQHLIYQALERSNIKKSSDVDQYLNFLSELGREVLDSHPEGLDEEVLESFFTQYLKKFIATDKEKMVEALIEAAILERKDGYLRFKYRYLFYFFASKNLADTLHRGVSAKETIGGLISRIHLEKSSNIVLFLCHHSKDPWILDEILYSVIDIFPEEKEATLDTDSLEFLKASSNSISDVVMKIRSDAHQEREEQDVRRDIIERKQEAFSEDEDLEDLEYIDPKEETSILIRKIERVFRTTEVCGQILRNRIGSLERENLELLYEESVSSLLKLLNIVLKISEKLQKILRLVELSEKEAPNATDDEIVRKVRASFMELNYTLMFSILRKIAFSLGSDTGREIYVSVNAEKDTAAVHLIQKIMELQFEKKLDLANITKLHKQFVSSKNPVCNQLLKIIVVYHCYMHDISYKERQAIASNLGINLHPLKVMESRKQQRNRTTV